ncbi:MAG: pyruvate dehydrogenase complex dihydrolipoamide acetyltransferase [Anaerolineae bacterium]
MAEVVNMPKLGFDMREGQLVKWVKKAGDSVSQGEIIAEIESDKATVEVEAYVSGTILELLVSEGDWVPIGAPIAIVGEPGEKVDRAALGITAGDAEPVAAAAATAPAADAAPAPPESARENGHGLPGGVRASPLARRIAEELGVDLRRVQGSGPQGRVVRADVEAFAEGAVSALPAAAAAPTPAPFVPVEVAAADQVVPVSRMRGRIGQRMVESKTTVPHFYVTTEIDMEAALALRKELNARRDEDDKLSVNDLIVKAAALALRRFPNINASFNGETIVRHGHVNVGIAVALDDGLINVVSRDADVFPLTQMGRKHREMVARAREGKLKPDDMGGETFAVSNLGPFDVDHFIAIINPPAAAILAVGSARQAPVVVDGQITVGWRMKATLSADHRVTDGAEAARFMQLLKELLEDPIQLLM